MFELDETLTKKINQLINQTPRQQAFRRYQGDVQYGKLKILVILNGKLTN